MNSKLLKFSDSNGSCMSAHTCKGFSFCRRRRRPLSEAAAAAGSVQFSLNFATGSRAREGVPKDVVHFLNISWERAWNFGTCGATGISVRSFRRLCVSNSPYSDLEQFVPYELSKKQILN